MTNTPQPRRSRGKMLVLAALLAVPFAGLALNAPWYWYASTMAYLYAVSRWARNA